MGFECRVCFQNIKEIMVSVNEKGSVQHRVTLQKRGIGLIQNIMLNNALINKSDNYHLQVDRFITNEIPEIMQNPRVLMKIRPRYEFLESQNYAPTNQIDGYHTQAYSLQLNLTEKHELLLKYYKFQPRVFSLAGLCAAFGQYVRKFNFILNITGADHMFVHQNGFGDARAIPELPIAGDQIDLGTYVPKANVVDYLKVGIEADGSVDLHFSRGFLSNFYIELDPVFAKIIGFPILIYSQVQGGNVHISNQANVDPLIDDQDFDLNLGVPDLGATGFESIISTKSIFQYDERISIDIEMALPIARTIDVFNKKEKHTTILSRFMLTDYKELETIIEQRHGVIMSKSILQDRLAAGTVDLVRGQPQTHTAQLLGGRIQAMDMRLVLRYKDFVVTNKVLSYNVKHKTMELTEHGFVDIMLHFIKKL